MGGLVSAIAWLEAGIVVAAGRVLAFGADPANWSIEAIASPLVIGWIGLAILTSATHLLPAIGPGDHLVHARQRQLLGRMATVRLVVLNSGVLALAVGLPLGLASLASLGAVLAMLGLGMSAVLLGADARFAAGVAPTADSASGWQTGWGASHGSRGGFR